MPPPYRIPYTLLAPRLPSLLIGQRRSLVRDLCLLFSQIGNAPRPVNADFIPRRDPFLLVMNHYRRADIPVWWSAIAAFKAVSDVRAGEAPGAVRMIIASQWTYAQRWQRAFVEPLTRFMIRRIAHAYDFVTIEPAELGASQAGARAQSIRRVLEAAKQAIQTGQPLGLAPEGGDSADGRLMRPPGGAGRFMLLLASTGLPFVPVGVYAEGNRLVAGFGAAFELKPPRGLGKPALDEWACREVMTRVARLLPAELRGAYQDVQ